MNENPRIKPIERATERSWEDWLTFLEGVEAGKLDHHGIAAKVYDELNGHLDNPGWWAQAVAVAYEQHIGRRLPGQQSDGKFQTSASKSTGLGMKELMDAWTAFATADAEVMDTIVSDPKVTGSDKRMNWRTKATDGSSILVTSEPARNGTATVIVTLTDVESHELNLAAKATWAAILGRFMKTIR